MASNIRRRLRIAGRVQGVNFRSATRERARSLGLTGWVRNRADNSVEALFEGDALDVEKLIAWCRRGPPSAQVSDVQVYEEPYRAEFTDFVVRYDSWE